MATDGTTSGSTEETSGQEQQQDQQQQAAQGTPGQDQQQQSQTPARLPDDHPLVTAYARQKQANAELQTQADKVGPLEQQLSELDTAKAEAAKVPQLEKQAKRLEEFLTALGGPIAKVLDSRTFSDRLFKSEDKITDIVKDWNTANPSQTSTALGGGPGNGGGKLDPNALLRAAALGTD